MSWFKKANPVKERWIAMYGSDYYNRHERWYNEICPILEKYLRTMVLATASQAVFRPKAEELERLIGQIQKIIRPVWDAEDMLPNVSAVWNFHLDRECEALWQESYRLFSNYGPMLARALIGYASLCWMAAWQPHTLVNRLVAQILLDNVPVSHKILEDMIIDGPDELTEAVLRELRGTMWPDQLYQVYIIHTLAAMSQSDDWAKQKLGLLPASYMDDPSIASEVRLIRAGLEE